MVFGMIITVKFSIVEVPVEDLLTISFSLLSLHVLIFASAFFGGI